MASIEQEHKERVAFFLKHAGWSYPSGATTGEQALARVECAEGLARAEEVASSRGWSTDWEHDPDVMDDDAGSAEGVASGQYVNLLVSLRDEEGGMLACLGGVVVESPSDPYVRVVGAELADEELWRERQATFLRACRWANVPEWVRETVLIHADA